MRAHSRRSFLKLLTGGLAVTTAGLYVPEKTYSFLWNNPLVKEKIFVAPISELTYQGGFVVPMELADQVTLLINKIGFVRREIEIKEGEKVRLGLGYRYKQTTWKEHQVSKQLEKAFRELKGDVRLLMI